MLYRILSVFAFCFMVSVSHAAPFLISTANLSADGGGYTTVRWDATLLAVDLTDPTPINCDSCYVGMLEESRTQVISNVMRGNKVLLTNVKTLGEALKQFVAQYPVGTTSKEVCNMCITPPKTWCSTIGISTGTNYSISYPITGTLEGCAAAPLSNTTCQFDTDVQVNYGLQTDSTLEGAVAKSDFSMQCTADATIHLQSVSSSIILSPTLHATLDIDGKPLDGSDVTVETTSRTYNGVITSKLSSDGTTVPGSYTGSMVIGVMIE